MLVRDILKRPVITEKATTGVAEGTHVFEVALEATKQDIRKAVEAYYGVQVQAVNTVVVRGKSKRFGRSAGRKSNFKKAYVKLSAGHSLNVFER